MRQRVHASQGFTLIELLMVIAIIGMLASIIVGSLNYARTRARDIKRITEVQNVQTALQLYFESNGNYPPLGLFATSKSLINPVVFMNEPKESSGVAPTYYKSYKKNGSVSAADECTQINDKCVYYHLGVDLELDGSFNQVLNSDADRSGSYINGLDSAGCEDEPARHCYDLTSP